MNYAWYTMIYQLKKKSILLLNQTKEIEQCSFSFFDLTKNRFFFKLIVLHVFFYVDS